MTASGNASVGAYEAKTHFSELLERVAAGEEITITRHGSPVARLVPVRSAPSQESRREVISQMRLLASRNRLRGLKVKDLMAEGRK
ncbi:MAG TPA: type II toxin-antitoxin system prevent-host-death family antitoxin [Pirellulales bacterium]|nr:type II toxin-antitoxin system prevent-host-death family antitoxin [Pirellulales bacterium]